MTISRNRVALGALAVGLLAAGLPALGQQQQAPESILPPGFNDLPPPAPAPTPTPTPAGPAPITLPSVGAQPAPTNDGAVDANAADVLQQQMDAAAAAAAKVEIPDFARRSLSVTGIAGVREGGMAPDAFGLGNGRYLETLMGRLDAPIASRWLSIALRRALASRVTTPAGLNGADFAAERAWLLVRMGEPVVARAVAQSVDPDLGTPKLYEATLQAGLASADPAALCPVADAARAASPDRAWRLAQAYCAGLAGNPDKAGELIDGARRSGAATGIDLLLAEKILGSGVQGRQAVTIEWTGVNQLTAWRYGLAMASGVLIPESLFATANPRVNLWRAQAPSLDAGSRVAVADGAAAQGVLSNAALVSLYGEIDASDEQNTAATALARDLRTTYADPDPAARVTMMRQLWDEPRTPVERYARLILTARAATLIPVASGTADTDRLIASMLSAGYDRPALRWANTVSRGSDGWAMLQIADPDVRLLSSGDVTAYRGGSSDPTGRKPAMYFAALAGLGRLSPGDIDTLAKSLDVDTSLGNAWTRAIDRAAAARQPGTVLLLAGVGMQTRDWRGVAPAALYRMCAAMHRVGLDREARLIAIEALTRL